MFDELTRRFGELLLIRPVAKTTKIEVEQENEQDWVFTFVDDGEKKVMSVF